MLAGILYGLPAMKALERLEPKEDLDPLAGAELKILKFYNEPQSPQEPEKRLVYGVVLRPNHVDAHMDIMSMSEVEKTAHRFMANKGKMGLMHEQDAAAVIVESYIAPLDFPMGAGEVRKGDWVLVALVIDDQIWGKIKSGELTGFSPGGKTRARILV